MTMFNNGALTFSVLSYFAIVGGYCNCLLGACDSCDSGYPGPADDTEGRCAAGSSL